MKKTVFLLFYFTLGLSLSLLNGCATIANGTQQEITIDTSPVTDTQCYMQNDKGKWYLDKTPGKVYVHRSYKDLLITAKKAGYKETTIHAKSKTKGTVFCNAVIGGAVGAAFDCANGAAYDYPNKIHVEMIPLNGPFCKRDQKK